MEAEQYQSMMNQLKEVSSQMQELQEQNRQMRLLLNSSISSIPILVRDEMASFLTEFAELLENRNPSETADAIRELTGILKELKDRLTNSELIHADMTSQVNYATEEIRSFATQLLNSDWMRAQQT